MTMNASQLTPKKVCVSLLAYNEGETIEKTIRAGYQQLVDSGMSFELWVFDNKSTDNTSEIVKKLQKELPQLYYYQQPENIGYAFSSLSTFKIPKADIYVSVDGDGQYSLADTKKLIGQLDKGYDLVYAWRKERHDPALRCIMSAVFNRISRILLNTKIRDLNCGFRCMTADVAKNINVIYKLNYVGPEIFVRASQKNFKATDIDVLHFDREAGFSVYTGLPSIIRNVIGMLKYLFQLRKEMNEGEIPSRPLLHFEIQ